MANTQTFRSSRFDRFAAYSFLAVLWLPFIAMLVAPNRQLTTENRQLAKFPGVDGTEFSRDQLGEFLKDNLGFRSEFVRAHTAIKLAAFGSATTRKVIVGKDDWLFINMRRAIATYTGEVPLTDRIVSDWYETLEQRASYLAKKNITFGFIAVPDKHFVYPEYLPNGIARHPEGSYNEKLLGQLDKHFNVITLFNDLKIAKSKGDLYYARDTHWNGRGAAVGYESILSQLGEFVPALEMESPCDYNVNVQQGSARDNDLDRLIGSKAANPQPKIFAYPRQPKAELTPTPHDYLDLEDEYRKRERSVLVYENPDPRVQGRRLVMFHTSFTAVALRPLLAEHFERAVFVRHAAKHVLAFHKLVVESENPTVVLNEIPTRYLTQDPKTAYRTEEWTDAPIVIATRPLDRRK